VLEDPASHRRILASPMVDREPMLGGHDASERSWLRCPVSARTGEVVDPRTLLNVSETPSAQEPPPPKIPKLATGPAWRRCLYAALYVAIFFTVIAAVAGRSPTWVLVVFISGLAVGALLGLLLTVMLRQLDRPVPPEGVTRRRTRQLLAAGIAPTDPAERAAVVRALKRSPGRANVALWALVAVMLIGVIAGLVSFHKWVFVGIAAVLFPIRVWMAVTEERKLGRARASLRRDLS
jgi:hypothetical protein